MALQQTGSITLADIQAEFGGVNPISMSEYYSAADGIPVSGVISISEFYGKAASSTTWYLRDGTLGLTAKATDSDFGGPAASGIDFRIVRVSGGVEVYINNGGGTCTKYSPSGSSSLLTTAESKALDTSGLTASEVKVDWSFTVISQAGITAYGKSNIESPGATYNATDNTYQALAVGESLGARFFASAEDSPSGSVSISVIMNVWVKDGSSETSVGTLKFEVSAYAEEGGIV